MNIFIDDLLAEVQEKKRDVFSLNLTELARQFRQETLALYPGARFISGLAHLIFIKALRLVPVEEIEGEEEDFETLSLRQLEEYAAFKEVAKTLSFIEREQSQCFWRPEPIVPVDDAPRPLVPTLDLEEFSKLFMQIWEQASARNYSIYEEEWSVADALKVVRVQLIDKKLTLHQLFPQEYSKERLIVTFLAVLELLKNQEAQLTKDQGRWYLLSST